MNIQFGRKIERETKIPIDKGILIAAPDEKEGVEAAQVIKEKFKLLGCKAELLKDPEHDVMLDCKQPVIALGNLANSKCVRYLYYKFLCMTDKSYPGTEGYNLRTIIDPFATGHHVIHIGYSDQAGLQNALKAFLIKCGNPLPYINDVFYKRLPYTDKYLEHIKNVKLPEKIELIPSINTSVWYMTGLMSYLTGDPEPLETYFDGWRKMIELSKSNPALISGTHLHMTRHIEVWRTLEFSGIFPDDLRPRVEECLYNWAESPEGKGYAKAASMRKYLPAHNHSMFCALSLIYLHDYFNKRYPELENLDEWKTAGDDTFHTFNHGGWKPYCDDSAYSNQITLPLVGLYSVFDDRHTFLLQSGKTVARWIKTIIGQNGTLPSFGDGSTGSAFPVNLVLMLSHFVEDPELWWLYKRFSEKKLNYDLQLQRLFDTGVQSIAPTGHPGISCIPMDKYLYSVWEVNPQEGRRLTVTPPYGPYENCFDKVSVRTGSDEIRDDFLLIDGLGSNGIHAYNDAMGILDYTSKGIVWLVEENDYRWPEPENCSIVTIAKDGYASDIPGFALMEEQKTLGEGQYYLRMRLKNVNETDWVREVYMVKGVCVLFHDTVIADQEGDYVISAHFRTPAKAWLEGNTVKSTRVNRNQEQYELRLTGYGSTDILMSLEEIPYGVRLFNYGGMYDKKDSMPEESNLSWKERYRDDRIVVTAVTTMTSLHMEQGDKISFTHLVRPAKKDDEEVSVRIQDRTLQLSYKGKEYVYPLAHVGATGKKSVPVERKTLVDKTPIKKEFTLAYSIQNMTKINADQYVCTTDQGKVIFVQDGKELWERSLEGTIHCLAYITPEHMIAVGHGNNQLSAMDLQGNLLWTYETTRIPTLYSSWELAYPQIVKITYFESKDSTVIVTGAGDNQIRLFNKDGELLNVFYIYATVPDNIEILDIDLDGELEILAAGKVDSSAGMFYVNDINGKPKKNIQLGGWLCNIKTAKFVRQDDKIILACGMNYSRNFKIISIEKGVPKVLSEKSLGGTVKSVCFNSDNTKVYAGTSKGSVLAFDKEGNHLWQVYVKDNVKDLIILDKNILTLCENGKVSIVSEEGVVLSEGCLPDAPTDSLKTGEKVLISCGKAVYSIRL